MACLSSTGFVAQPSLGLRGAGTAAARSAGAGPALQPQQLEVMHTLRVIPSEFVTVFGGNTKHDITQF